MENKVKKKKRIGFLRNILRQIKYLIPRYYV
jgi:hypothetical protein